MTQQEWDSKTNQEKHDYLVDQGIKISSQMAVDGSIKAGAPNPSKTYYTAYCGEVQVSESNLSSAVSKKQAEQFIESLVD